MGRKKRSVRRPGIEPGSTAWKATMLTITPATHVHSTACHLHARKRMLLICLLTGFGRKRAFLVGTTNFTTNTAEVSTSKFRNMVVPNSRIGVPNIGVRSPNVSVLLVSFVPFCRTR